MVRKFANIYSIRFQVVAVHADVASAAAAVKKHIYILPRTHSVSLTQSISHVIIIIIGGAWISLSTLHTTHMPTHPHIHPVGQITSFSTGWASEVERVRSIHYRVHPSASSVSHQERYRWVKVGLAVSWVELLNECMLINLFAPPPTKDILHCGTVPYLPSVCCQPR